MNATEKLSQMILSGNLFQYREDKIRFLDFTERDGIYRICVIKNKSEDVIEKGSPVDLDNFLARCEEIISEPIDKKPINGCNKVAIIKEEMRDTFLPQLLQENKQTFKSIADMLVDDIKKVRENKDYVPQAKQSANSANALINLVKVQLDIIKHN